MKLSTMLLPTGEFVLIASQCPPGPTDESLVAFRKAIGAAGVFMTDEDVEVEDAFPDENAVRRDEAEPEKNGFSLGEATTSFYFPNLSIDKLGTLREDGTVTFSATAQPSPGAFDTVDESWQINEGDLAITRAIMEDQEFTPAGLVAHGGRLVSGTLPAEEQGVPGADPRPEGGMAVDVDQPLGEAVEDEDSYDEEIGLPEPREIKPGDKVVVNGRSWLNTLVENFRGVVQTPPEKARRHLEESVTRDGYTVCVKETEGSGRQMYFRPADVEHDEEAQNG